MSKTPIMILQELVVYHKLPSPEYSVVQADIGTHEFEFHATVCVQGSDGEEVFAHGRGPNKKIAQHNAAHNALEILEKIGILPKNSETHTPFKQTVNCIMTLRDICVENKLPAPEFVFISDVGPPHCREFTFQCKLGSLCTQATQGSKKQAKQVAAEKMLDKIKNILPDLIDEYHNKKIELDNNTEEVIKKYIELTPKDVKTNFSIPIVERDKELGKLMRALELTIDDFEEYFQNATEENTKSILNKLELTHEILIMQEKPPVVAVTVNAEIPLTTMETGLNVEDATSKAFATLHDSLKLFLTI